jgi:hypothetical protein
MSVKTLLDDAAAQATGGLRIDLGRAQQDAVRRRARARHRASLTMGSAVTVAALIGLIAVLMPTGPFHQPRVVPATSPAPTGLPDHWYYAPPWTPPVTRHPMAAASMVLDTPLFSKGDGPVLVSADAKQYVSLPWSAGDSLVALSTDGRDVAWVSQRTAAGKGPKRPILHWIRLRDGQEHDVKLDQYQHVNQVLWVRENLYVVTSDPASSQRVWVLNPGPGQLSLMTQIPSRVQLALTDPTYVGSNVETAQSEDLDRIVSPATVLDPTGHWSAVVVGTTPGSTGTAGKFSLQTGSGSGASWRWSLIPITGDDPIVDARVLGWADAGVVVRVESRDRHLGNLGIALRIFPTRAGAGPSESPLTGKSTVVSRRTATLAYPVAVAPAVVAQGQTVAAAAPKFPGSDRSHTRMLIAMYGWSTIRALGYLVLAVLLLVRTGYWLRRRRQR